MPGPATTAKDTHALALGLLILAVVVGGILAAAHSAEDWCVHHHCPGEGVVLAGGDGQPRHQPASEPCAGDPACGGGAAHTLGTTLASGALALIGVVLLQPRQVGRAVWPAVARLYRAPFTGGLDHPPRLPS